MKLNAVNRIISLILLVNVISALVLVDQLELNRKITMADYDHYLEEYVGDSEKFALLLDYDGTLAPIAPHPNMTYMTDYTKEALVNISSNPNVFVAIISGRAVDNVREKIGIENIVYGGNHGLEILYPNGTRYTHEIPGMVSGKFEKMLSALEAINRDGSWIENKKFSLTFHYRAVKEEDHDKMRDHATEIIESFGYRANKAHCAVEAKPPVLWHKGKAAEYILNHNFGTDWRNKIKCLFAGDDTTDEDIFELLQGTGITFRVTTDPNLSTFATYRIPSTESVTKLLQWVDRKYSIK